MVLGGVGAGGDCSRGLAGKGHRESKGDNSQDGDPFVQTLTLLLTTGTAPSVVRGLQLHSSGSPASLEASWSGAPGHQDSYQLLLYHLESQTLARNISVSPGILSYSFDNLLPGCQYVLEVVTWAGSLKEKTSIHQWTGKVGSQAGPQGAARLGEVRTMLSPEPCRRRVSVWLGFWDPSCRCWCRYLAPGSFLKPGSALSILPAEPVAPAHLVLRALNTSSLKAFWNSSEGAAWFHLMLTDDLGGTNLTVVVRRGVFNHTFLHLSPGTPYKLKLCAVAGPHWVVGPNATEWTCECLGVPRGDLVDLW